MTRLFGRMLTSVGILCAAGSLAPAADVTPGNPSFEEIALGPAACGVAGEVSCFMEDLNGDGTGETRRCWSCSGDVAVLDLHPCLQPQLPSDGDLDSDADGTLRAVCLSTGDLNGDGTGAVGDLRSDLVSPPIELDFRPDALKISFEYDYGSDETLQSLLFNDTVDITLLTPIGPYPILVSDTWGTTPSGRGLRIGGSRNLSTPNPGCPVARQTGKLFVDFKRGIPSGLSDPVANGPVQVQFSVSDQGGTDGLTFLCLDNLVIRARKR